MIKGFVSGVEKDVSTIRMRAGNTYVPGWEVRKQDGTFIWYREDLIQTVTGSLQLKGYQLPMKIKSIKGNSIQSGTPTPDSPIELASVGVNNSGQWTIPISCAGQTTSIALGQTNAIRKIKKRVFNGAEAWTQWDYGSVTMFYIPVTDGAGTTVYSTHFINGSGGVPSRGYVVYNGTSNKNMVFRMLQDGGTVDAFKSWLAAQYAAGTPVTVWYVLANNQTGIVNEPLCKIGDYADELTSDIATLPEIPTATGSNTLTVDTVTAPSSLTIKGHAKKTNV